MERSPLERSLIGRALERKISLADVLSERRYLSHLARTYDIFKEKHAHDLIDVNGSRHKAETGDIFDFSIDIPGLNDINLIGCQGVNTFNGSNWNGSRVKIKGENAQVAVARSSQMGSNLSTRGGESMTFLLGDNFYSDGLGCNKSFDFNPATSGSFCNNFTAMNYGKTFAVLGNHDWSLWSHGSWRNSEYKLSLALNQVRVDYDQSSNTTDWNMPYRYYFISTEFADIYVIDSTSFPYDQRQQNWLRYVKGRQVALSETPRAGSRTCNGKHQILVSHHALLSVSKRSPLNRKAHKDKGKYSKYFEPSLSKEKTQGSLNETLYYLLRDYKFDVVLSAHDHLLAAYDILNQDGSTTLQVVSGGGGAELAKINKNDYQGLIKRTTGGAISSSAGELISPTEAKPPYAHILANPAYGAAEMTEARERNLFIEYCHGYANMTLSEDSVDIAFFWLQKGSGAEAMKSGISKVKSGHRPFGRSHTIR